MSSGSRSRGAGSRPALERILAESASVVTGVSASGQTLEAMLPTSAEAPDRAAVRAVATGSVRWYLRLSPVVDALASASVDPLLRSLLVSALHQLEYSRTPAPTVVNGAVSAARLLGLARASGLVNAVLRRFLRERDALTASTAQTSAQRTAHPAWLIDRLTADWGEQRALEILDANNAHPPMTLRVNQLRTSVPDLQARLSEAGIVSSIIDWAPDALMLDRGRNVHQIPGFREGEWSVQDAGAQLAAPLLDARAPMRVLDACAAPGGKTTHLLERTPGIRLVATDLSEGRLARVSQNLARLGLAAELRALDARVLEDLKPESFDRVLVDVPCSGTGVIRRHPDIKLLRRGSDIAAMAATGRAILDAGFARLRPGGRLVYATCSVLKEENEGVVGGFLAAHGHQAVLVPVPSGLAQPPDSLRLEYGIHLLPGSRSDTDGFYYACIEKTTTGH